MSVELQCGEKLAGDLLLGGFEDLGRWAGFRDALLRPFPPVEFKQKDVRYLHIHEDDQLDEARFAAWVKQASQLPSERM